MAEQIPHDLEAEQAVLGSFLIDPDAVHETATFLEPGDFYVACHVWICAAVYEASQDGGVDIVTIADKLHQAGKLEQVGLGDSRGVGYLTHLLDRTPSALRVADYARIVVDQAGLRRMIAAAGTVAQVAHAQDGASLEDKRAEAVRAVMEATKARGGRELRLIREPVMDVFDEIERRGEGPTGLQTGFGSLDTLWGGLAPGDLVYVAGRPGMGKSAFLTNLAGNVGKDHRVAVFTLEMTAKQYARRLISRASDISAHTLRTRKLRDDQWPLLTNAMQGVVELDVWIDDTARTVQAFRAKLARVPDVELCIVDYLQLMNSKRNRQSIVAETTDISKALKSLALELKLPLVVASQLSRACEQRPDKRPMLSDLRESGSLEQDANIVMFLYRDDYYNPNTEQPNIVEFITRKSRDGPTGTCVFYWKKETMTFVPMAYGAQHNG